MPAVGESTMISSSIKSRIGWRPAQSIKIRGSELPFIQRKYIQVQPAYLQVFNQFELVNSSETDHHRQNKCKTHNKVIN